MPISVYLSNKYLDCLANDVGFNVAGVWIQLHTADPGANGTTFGLGSISLPHRCTLCVPST